MKEKKPAIFLSKRKMSTSECRKNPNKKGEICCDYRETTKMVYNAFLYRDVVDFSTISSCFFFDALIRKPEKPQRRRLFLFLSRRATARTTCFVIRSYCIAFFQKYFFPTAKEATR